MALFRVDPRVISGLRCRGVPRQHRAVSPVSADVVVALGGGITADGEPRAATVARARRAALYRSGRAQRIVMSGAYGMYDPPPLRAEATAMAEIAVAAGVPPGSITAEIRSRDTSATSGSPSRCWVNPETSASSW